MAVVVLVYRFAVTLLALYGLYVIALLVQSLRYRNRCAARSPEAQDPADLPAVVVQVPTCNERYVVERSIDAVAALDWPRDRLHIQILDDSTDDTTMLAQARIEHHRRCGIDITLIHRPRREGYKAGALANGLRSARGEFVAVFDADFVPPPDFLHRMMPYFGGEPPVGWVQARWDHLNYDRSTLTRALAIAVDGHFLIEQFARNRSGWPMIFNGSAGIWHRACIEASGGWQSDTLCEDIDLSYRATLAGWRSVLVLDIAVPQEEPVSVGAMKSQHARVMRGGAQCLRKHAVSILISRRWSLSQKIAGLLFLAGFTVHPLMVLFVLLSLPLSSDSRATDPWLLAILGLGGLGLPIEYVVAQWKLYRHDGVWLRRLAYLPLWLAASFGIALNNTFAVLAGLFTPGGEFQRTPKIGVEAERREGYLSRGQIVAWLEIGMSLYALIASAAMQAGHNLTFWLLLSYAIGFGSVGIASLIETARIGRPGRLKTTAGSRQEQLP